MLVQLPLFARALAAVRLAVHPGQPIVIAFCDGLELRESALLERIRAELRGLGAALFLISGERAFSFRPDDELALSGIRAELEPSALLDLRSVCGVRTAEAGRSELTLIVVAGDGQLASRQVIQADDGLVALAQGLSEAGRDVVSRRHSLTLSRRELVLASLVGAFALLAANGCRTQAASHAVASPTPSAKASQTRTVTLNINGQAHALELEPRVSLLDALRERLGLTGSKKGCDHGQCGACTVLVAGRRVNACLTLAVMVADSPITTIEGLAQGEQLHPMQEAFVALDALQCGYCTPGQIMSAVGLVRENRAHTESEVREHMSGNICRCGAYTNIVAAIQRARDVMGPG